MVNLTPHTKLGPYEIQAPLGAGGMGEVYKARDTRLDRTVAIKVLPENLASDPDLRQRFEREAKAVAALSHPHICTLHDIGSRGGIDFLVMEFLEGQTLAQRLERGALPLDQALAIAIQIADALDTAHRQGIVHRDLKPGNIMLTKAGAKLLDFGLAKSHQRALSGSGRGAAATTLSQPLTGRGTLLGTIPYMAPEQLHGMEADSRTDLFAFGTVIYEAVTGVRAFDGETNASLMAAILEHEPPELTVRQPLATPALERVLAKCLAKDPEERWQTAKDLVDELRWLSAGSGDTARAHPVARPAVIGRRNLAAATIAGVVLGALLSGLVIWSLRSPEAPSVGVSRVVLPFGSNLRLAETQLPAVAMSSDGRSFVFHGVGDERPQLYLRRLDDLGATPIAGTEAGSHPILSPDGDWLAFYVDQALKKVPLVGGPALTICEVPGPPFGGSWGVDGSIVFALESGGLWRVSASGGKPEALTRLAENEYSHRLPHWLPGGDAVLYTVTPEPLPSWDQTLVVVESLASGSRKVLIDGGADGRYLPTGHLVYVRLGTLLAVPFDLQPLEVTGEAVGMLPEVRQGTHPNGPTMDVGVAQMDVSATGSLVYVSGVESPDDLSQLLWIDRKGETEVIPAPKRAYVYPRISPDGGRIAVTEVSAGKRTVWVYDLARRTTTRVAPAELSAFPAWTVDGRRVAFAASGRGARPSLFWASADGTGEAERLTTTSAGQLPAAWTPDGQTLALIQGAGASEDWDIWMLSLADGTREARPLVATPFVEGHPAFSPDGHWLAFASQESGAWEVYVQPYPGPGERRQVSTAGGSQPAWSADGKSLFYIAAGESDRHPVMLQVEVTTSDSVFHAGQPRELFELPKGTLGLTLFVRSYDVAPGGQRFIFVQYTGPPAAEVTEAVLVLNWFEELRARVPSKGPGSTLEG